MKDADIRELIADMRLAIVANREKLDELSKEIEKLKFAKDFSNAHTCSKGSLIGNSAVEHLENMDNEYRNIRKENEKWIKQYEVLSHMFNTKTDMITLLKEEMHQLKKENGELKSKFVELSKENLDVVGYSILLSENKELKQKNAELTEKLAEKCGKNEVKEANKKISVDPYNNNHLSTILDNDKIYLKLADDGHNINLIACDKEGKVLPGGNLMSFDRATKNWYRIGAVDENLGFLTDDSGHVLVC